MEAMRAGRGRGGRAAGHEGHGGCGRKQHGLKERRMWEGSEVGEDSSAGRQQAPVLRSVAYLFFSLRLAALFPRRGEAANDREKEQVVEECKQKVSGDWKSETDDRAYCFGYEWLEILWLDVPGAVRPFQDRSSDGEHIRRQHTKQKRSRSKTKVSTIERMIISKRQEQANGHGIFKRQEQANGHGILCKMSRETRRGTGAW
ncbi:uncharacterized protein LOC125521344 isoform X6 [Triticum urartu]|uniref:uncharacterized protein LOC125521344 isoform X6 n=1 Tax=Triticum urartu TaxID=4572 RepID=UPI00204388BC|nr:uncharacterized protein LOC125521344 isoform X6 [Triticum urartu]XP_048542366.1 uncharacterized protein LOC125521344 isoform X6 [Triticum urartu]